MTTGLIVLAIAVAVVIYLVKFRRKAAVESIETTPQKTAKQFHGVSIHPGPSSCEGAKALVGKRFLPDEVPLLPLKDCDAANCTCVFEHHRDRRSDDDRRAPIQGSLAEIAVQSDDKRSTESDRRNGNKKNK